MTSSAPRTVCYGWARTFSLHPRRGRRSPCLTAEPVVIDYETFCKIHDCHDRQRLTIAQTARALGLDPRTVATWLARSRFEPRRSQPRGSVLDSFKPRITRLLETHPYSAQQIFQRLREEGYRGGITILRDYVRRIRPTKRPVYLKLHFAPGECAQVDWGAYGTVAVGNTRRRLSFFVMVLAFSRQMYVEFTGWILTRSATPSIALLHGQIHRQKSVPVSNPQLPPDFEGKQSAWQEGISSRFNEVGRCTSR